MKTLLVPMEQDLQDAIEQYAQAREISWDEAVRELARDASDKTGKSLRAWLASRGDRQVH